MKSLILGLVVSLAIIGCGKDNGPGPGPQPPQTAFTLTGKHISVTGEMKPGAVASIAEVKAVVKAAIKVLEK